MKTKRMMIESGRRGSAEELEKTLKELPLEIKGCNLQLSARRGLGNIVYIRPYQGEITSIQVSGVNIKNRRNKYLVLDYKNQMFEILYN